MEKKDLKIVFFGTPEFAVESLSSLIDNGFNVVAVVTMPDKIAGRGHHTIQSDVKQFALAKGLPILQPEKLKDENFVSTLRSYNADLFIVIAFRMLPQVVWNMPRLGTFNLHASLLPKYRGAAPLNWAVINGDDETGVTTFFLKQEIDTGDIIQQRRIAIDIHDNVGVIHDRLMHLGAEMVIETVENILSDNVHPIPQDRLQDIPLTPAPKIFKETCHIDWTKPAINVYNLIRGLSPYPAAWSELSVPGKVIQLKIFETELPYSASETTPGKMSVINGDLFIDCSDGRLKILSLQQSGKKRLATYDFLRGFNPDGIILS